VEIVDDGDTGVLFTPGSVDALAEALRETDWDRFDVGRLRATAQRFSSSEFRAASASRWLAGSTSGSRAGRHTRTASSERGEGTDHNHDSVPGSDDGGALGRPMVRLAQTSKAFSGWTTSWDRAAEVLCRL
jgi:hypothetical protein